MQRSFGTWRNPEAYTHFTNSCAEIETFNLGWGKSAPKEDALGYLVHDKEEERMVCHELRASVACSPCHDGHSAGSSLSALLVHFHRSLMEHFRQKQVILFWHAWEIGSALAEGIAHAHARENGLESITLFQFEPGYVHLHVILTHGVLAEPLAEFVRGDFTLQLWTQNIKPLSA